MSTVSLNKSTLSDHVAQVKALDARIAALESERRVHIAHLLTGVGSMTGTFQTDAGSFTVSENNTYNQDTMRSLLSPGQVRRCTVPKLDSPTVKRLYPDAYAAAKENRGHKVTIR